MYKEYNWAHAQPEEKNVPIQKKRIPYKTLCIKNIIGHMHIQKKRIPYKTHCIKKGVWKRKEKIKIKHLKKDKDKTLRIKKGIWRRKNEKV